MYGVEEACRCPEDLYDLGGESGKMGVQPVASYGIWKTQPVEEDMRIEAYR